MYFRLALNVKHKIQIHMCGSVCDLKKNKPLSKTEIDAVAAYQGETLK